MSTPKFAHIDTPKPDGFYVHLERLVLDDYDMAEVEDEGASDGRRAAFERGEWHYVGVRALARCLIVNHGVGTILTLESPGLWGIESDSGEEYFAEVYEEQKAELLAMLEAMKSPIVEAAQ